MCSTMDLCFMCSNDYNCIVVDDGIVTQVEYLMPEITIIKLGIPLHICSTCDDKLHSFSEFKQACVENSQRVEASMKAQACGFPLRMRDDGVSITPITNTHDEPDSDQRKRCQPPDPEFVELPLEVNIMETSTIVPSTSHHQVFEPAVKQEPHHSDDSDFLQPTTQPTTNKKQKQRLQTRTKSDSNNKNKSLVLLNDNTNSENNFQCSICKKYFAFSIDLKRHKRVHYGIGDFLCSQCNKRFLRKDNFTRHLKIHSGQKEFQCPTCNNLFSRKEHLTTHMKTHTGVKDYQCHVCNKCFMRKSRLTEHMKSHSEVKDYQCFVCNTFYTFKSKLNAHMKTHKGK